MLGPSVAHAFPIMPPSRHVKSCFLVSWHLWSTMSQIVWYICQISCGKGVTHGTPYYQGFRVHEIIGERMRWGHASMPCGLTSPHSPHTKSLLSMETLGLPIDASSYKLSGLPTISKRTNKSPIHSSLKHISIWLSTLSSYFFQCSKSHSLWSPQDPTLDDKQLMFEHAMYFICSDPLCRPFPSSFDWYGELYYEISNQMIVLTYSWHH